LEKLALQVVQNPNPGKEIIVTKENLSKYVGQPRFSASRFYDKTPTVKA
jgi:ATP-dependent Lon protease